MPFLMIRNDITKVAADAIVNPANRNLLQGSGTSRAIYQAAGEQELTAACEAIGRCDLGRAVCTPAFGLPATYIFHAVCPAWHGGGFGEAEQLAGAYHSALELAAEYHCESVAFPLLSSGNYGYPKEQAFRIAVDTITQYVMEHDLTVYLVLYDQHSLAVSRKLFAKYNKVGCSFMCRVLRLNRCSMQSGCLRYAASVPSIGITPLLTTEILGSNTATRRGLCGAVGCLDVLRLDHEY